MPNLVKEYIEGKEEEPKTSYIALIIIDPETVPETKNRTEARKAIFYFKS